jgi:hypothetical protein
MADIFISYAQGDREWVAQLASTLEGEGFSVWWDPNLLPGMKYRDAIATELQTAKSVVVVWSHLSTQSDWVRDEAEDARQSKKLIPVLKEPVPPPHGFRQLQTADLSQWRGRKENPEFRRVVNAARGYAPLAAESLRAAEMPAAPPPVARVTEPSHPASATPPRDIPVAAKIALGVFAAIFAVWLLGWLFMSSPANAPAPAGSQNPDQTAVATPAPAQTQQGAGVPANAPPPAPEMASPSAADTTADINSPRNAQPAPSRAVPVARQPAMPSQDGAASADNAQPDVPPPSVAPSNEQPAPPPATDEEAIKEERARELEKAWQNPH